MEYDDDSEGPTGGDNAMPLLAGRYRVLEQLGQGGMGNVWLAEDVMLDNRKFAIKMLPAPLVSDESACARMKKETLAAMKLSHPNIVTVRGFEENGGNPFIVMDYVDGESLSKHLRRSGGRISAAEVLKILKPVAQALDYAHENRIVHRDVKPGNIMISNDGKPYILDFGIAREMSETMTRVTGRNSSGTLMYMSPEQLNGDEPAIAQDVYSLAAVAYECLAGNPPFFRGDLAYQIMNKQPPPLPSGYAPEWLERSIMSGLAKDLGARPKTCAEMLNANEKCKIENVKLPRDAGAAASGRPPYQGDANNADAPTAPEKSKYKRIAAGVAAVVASVVAIKVLMSSPHPVRVSPELMSSPHPVRVSPEENKVATYEVSGVQLWEGGPYWADRNIGADKPEDYGYYFWWGDTNGCKRQGNRWVENGSNRNFEFKINNTPTSGKDNDWLKSNGYIDENGNLASSHDAAAMQWGKGWRMPTDNELTELRERCYWKWTTRNGVEGQLVRGRGKYASNAIFLPAAGIGIGSGLEYAGSDGHYWSSTPESGNSSRAWSLFFDSSYARRFNWYRYFCQSVRPVRVFAK